jgi:hypothetical protein
MHAATTRSGDAINELRRVLHEDGTLPRLVAKWLGLGAPLRGQINAPFAPCPENRPFLWGKASRPNDADSAIASGTSPKWL